MGETVESIDIRFGSGDQETNQPHIDHLIEAKIVEQVQPVPAKETKAKS